jgi:Ser/Thr protein kinase RdoA (MazF antagonist)
MISMNGQRAIREFTGYGSGDAKNPSRPVKVTTLPGGLINHSYKVEIPEGKPLLLQVINKKVFTDPDAVQDNYIDIWNFVQQQQNNIVLPAPVYTISNHSHFIDEEGEYWRAFRFIEGSSMHTVATSPAEAFATAQTFGQFTAALRKYDAKRLRVVIPRFHDLSFRYEQFMHALKNGNQERIRETADMIKGLTDRVHYNHFFQGITQNETDFPVRVMHHDAKIANVLFEKTTGKVICPVDFDTVMPGYYFSDMGDMVRSMACNIDENDTDFDRIVIQKDYYKAIVEGYLSVMDPLLTAKEKKHIHHAGLLMIFMQALRFLSDYLENDRYYRITYPTQNRDRATNQCTLLERLEESLRNDWNYAPSDPLAK